MIRVAALFVRSDSIYKSIPEVDCWDIDRDARLYRGNHPVIAHPPCRAWGQLSHMAKPRPDEKSLAITAIDMVRRWGGVLEHPRNSSLWPVAGLPVRGFDAWGGWTLPIAQYWFGHRAEKMTFLYIVGCTPRDVPIMPMILGDAPCICGSPGRKKNGRRSAARPEISHREREATPVDLAKWLVDLANLCRQKGE